MRSREIFVELILRGGRRNIGDLCERVRVVEDWSIGLQRPTYFYRVRCGGSHRGRERRGSVWCLVIHSLALSSVLSCEPPPLVSLGEAPPSGS